ncbi:hypothetical protein A3A63_02035 [Candidatus Gottesmanbacteria bacterium RIFCSPLOWO2_01_FULL_46_9]|uniref:M23ase beta-sheet core domain-containing protein n=1 Tax=Candidatus Gottesmanbacteria bacterium RIFCSPLOWO2_01_FULL_46_9 TaxID=1798394 RepID=A0A1F6AXT6_9BACT|nr:MAG: hypothetical protein A3A63_02035 [Candidatus Gottesmanbacteria bacterium RIFCSPLOWO2_01_FULL_46_9]
MKKYQLQKILASLIVVLFIMQQVAVPFSVVNAQTATDSAMPIDTPLPTETPTPTQNPFDVETSQEPSPSVTTTPSPTPTQSPSPTSTLTPTPLLEPTLGQLLPQISSGRIRRALAAQRLAKGFYRAAEGVTVSVDNVVDQSSDIHVSVLNSEGVDTPVVVDTVQSGETTTVTIHQRSSLRPGKYKVKVFQKDTLLSEQDFLWGVLAVNPNKSIYPPGETADLAIAVLNEFGKMVCNANVILDITNPNGEITTLSTDEGTIAVNEVCKLHDFTLTPDYEAHYRTTINGRYGMTLTATTINGTYTISDSFEVDGSAVFDVERITATRIFPPASYPVTIRVTAKEDFVGSVEDTIPQNFTVSQLSGVTQYNEAQIVADQSPGATTSAQTISLGMPFAGDFPETQGFGTQVTEAALKQKYLRFGVLGHDGADFAVPVGTNALVVDDGVVAYIGSEPYGKTVIIEHSWGRSYYGHLSEFKVSVGQSVRKGSIVALSGNTGESTGPHLHFGMRMNTYDKDNGFYGKINPMPYLTASSAVISDVAVKKIFWDVAIKKGETKVVGYTFKAPPQSPQFYLMGPLRFRGQFSQSLPLDVTSGGEATPSGDNAFVLGATEATPSSQPATDTIATSSADLSASPSGTLNDAIRILKRRPRERMREQGLVFSESRQWQLAIDAPGNTISSIEHVTGTLGTTGTTDVISYSNGTALDKMFHFCSFRGNPADAQHDQTYRATYLNSTSQLTIQVGRTPNQDLTYDCYIVIYTADSDLVVNRYSGDSTLNPGPRNVTITAVSSTSQAFVIPHGESIPNDQTIGQEEEYEYRLTSTTNVGIYYTTYNNAAANTIRFEVVDWNNSDIRVQHMNGNTMTTGETSDTVTLTNTVDTAKTWIIVTARETGAAYDQAQGVEDVRADLQDANTVRLRRGYVGSPAVADSWSAQAIEDRSDYGLWNVQRGSIAFAVAETSDTLTLSPPVNATNAIPLGGAFPNFSWTGSNADTTVSRLRDSFFTLTMTDSSTLTAARGSTSVAADIDVQVVEFIKESYGLTAEGLMRHGNWFSKSGVEQYFTF